MKLYSQKQKQNKKKLAMIFQHGSMLLTMLSGQHL
jgi:hypothetical protein